MYFGKPIPEWITEHRNDTITLGELSDGCEKAQASCLRLAERVLKVGRDKDLAAYVWLMQEYLNEKKALDLALNILGERYGYPDCVCNGCYYNDGEVHAQCVVCAKAEKMP